MKMTLKAWPIYFITILLAVAVSFLATQYFSSSSHTTIEQSESVYDRVMRTGVLRCGYTFYSVGLRKNANGEIEGIYKDVMDHMAALLDLKIEWVEEVGWGQQIEGLKTDRYDLVCSPANMTGPRVRHADMSPALFYSPVYAWARVDDQRFNGNNADNLKRANQDDVIIATIDGEQAEAQAKQFFPQAQLFSAPQSASFSTMFMNVTTGKADLAIAEPASVLAFLENNPDIQLVPIHPDEPLILAVNIMLMKSNEFAFHSLISNALTTLIANGVMDQIIDQWEPYPKSYVRTPMVK